MKSARYEKLMLGRRLAEQWLELSKAEEVHGEAWGHRQLRVLVNKGLNDAGAWLNLAYAYDEGRGIPMSRVQAIRWYRKAWRRGVTCAALNLGIMLETEGRLTNAEKWYQHGIRNGDTSCEFRLARLWLRLGIHREDTVRLLNNVMTKGPQDYWVKSKDGDWRQGDDNEFLEAKEILEKLA